MPSGPPSRHFEIESIAAGKVGGTGTGFAEYVDHSVDVRVLYLMRVSLDEGIAHGWVAERLKAPVLKTGRP
ncbi:MAG: hypothetical protein U1E33_06120, partial [Rhodospirillales bacterium]